MISPNRTKPPRSGCPQQKQLMNKTFLAMMEDSGFDVELHYVERGFEVSEHTGTEIRRDGSAQRFSL